MSITFYAAHNTTHPKFGDIVDIFPGSPELNVANGNAAKIFKALGFYTESPDFDFWGGQLDAGDLMDRIEKAIPELVERIPSDTKEPGCCRVIDFGCSADQADRYFRILTDIAFFAMENGCFVSWA
jgi:hypothetical protein